MFHPVTFPKSPAEDETSIGVRSVFGSPQWLALWRHIGGTPLFFEKSDSETSSNTCAQFSATSFGSSFLTRIQTHVDGLPGMVVTPDWDHRDSPSLAVADELRNEALKTLQSYAGLYAHWVDYYRQFSAESVPDGWTVREVCAQRIVLDGFESRFRDSVRRHVVSGKRQGVVTRKAQSQDDARVTYELAHQTGARHNRNREYPLAFYEELLELSLADERIIWLMCEHSGQVIGAHIALYDCDTVLSWAPYMDHAHTELKPAYVLMDAVLSESRKRGAAYVNLGATPAGADGVERFKEGFGAEPYRYNVFVYRSLIAKALGKGVLS